MLKKTVFWQSEKIPAELHTMLTTLGEEYAIAEGFRSKGLELSFVKQEEKGISEVTLKESEATITYNSVSNAARGVGTVLSGLEEKGKTPFETLGIMLDCSRNAVMKIDYLKKWLRRLALMGYNMAMLYTEDTYQLPDEPFFGYLRGPYTIGEIKEVDAYAASLGIEMIGCIQTLGHLEQMLRWAEYNKVKDTQSVLLVDEEETYRLIDKMLAFWNEALGSRRIHIGMDETHDLGRGRFMDVHGYERGFDIFNRHLAKVNKMCADYGLKAMIWSDMYFRMGCESGNYYDKDTVIPDNVKDKIPTSVDLVYWDYYHEDREFYIDWITRHRDLGFEPPVASGVWTWSKLWYDHQKTVQTVRPCLEACHETNLKELFFTMWGDDGASCEFDSSLAGLCWAAELSFGGKDDEERLNKRFKAVCHDDYAAYIKASAMQENDTSKSISPTSILWDDPLLGIHWKDMVCECSENYWNHVSERFDDICEALEAYRDETRSPSLAHAHNIACTLKAKIDFRRALVEAYDRRDRDQLAKIKEEQVPAIMATLKEFNASMRKQWMRRNKPFGFETIQNRINALIGRYEEAATVIGEFLTGELKTIAVLESYPKHDRVSGSYGYRRLCAGTTIS